VLCGFWSWVAMHNLYALGLAADRTSISIDRTYDTAANSALEASLSQYRIEVSYFGDEEDERFIFGSVIVVVQSRDSKAEASFDAVTHRIDVQRGVHLPQTSKLDLDAFLALAAAVGLDPDDKTIREEMTTLESLLQQALVKPSSNSNLWPEFRFNPTGHRPLALNGAGGGTYYRLVPRIGPLRGTAATIVILCAISVLPFFLGIALIRSRYRAIDRAAQMERGRLSTYHLLDQTNSASSTQVPGGSS